MRNNKTFWIVAIVALLLIGLCALTGHHDLMPIAAFAAAPGAAKPLAPFRYNTRQKIRPMGVRRAWVNNSQLQDVELANIGLLARIWIHVTGTLNLGGVGVLADEGPWNLIKRITLESNEGGVMHWDTSGYGANIVGRNSLARGFRLDAGGIGDTAPHADVYAAPTANGNNTWSLWYPVLVNLSQFVNRATGLVALQAREIQVKLKIQTEDVANVTTNVGTGFAGNLDFYVESYEVPPAGVALPDFDIIHTFETSKDFTATGYVDYDVPPLGNLLQLIHIVKINSLRSDAIDRWELRFNQNDTPLLIDRALLRMRQQMRMGVSNPVGVYSHDFCQGVADPFDDDMPDVVDTRNPALTQSRIYITDGTALGAVNTIRTIRRVLAAARIAS